MFNLTVRQITTLFTALFYFMLGGDMLAIAEEEPKGLAAVVREAVLATGENYEAIRDRLVEQARQNREPFLHLQKTTTDELSKCVCSIVLEYVDQGEKIAEVAKLEPVYGFGRGSDDMYDAAVKLENRFKTLPFYLLESFWKQNKVTRTQYHDFTRGYVACVIGRLHLKLGRIPLEQVLLEDKVVRPHEENESVTISGIIHGLIHLNMRESIPALVAFCENNNRDQKFAAIAISMLADVSYVEQLIPSIKNAYIKGELTDRNNETKAAGFDCYRDLLIQQSEAFFARQKSRGHTNPEDTAPNRVPE